MNEDWREREADLRSEYEAEATYEAADDCDHVNYNLVDIFDVELGEVFFRVQCNDCEKFSELSVPEEDVVRVMEHCLFNGIRYNWGTTPLEGTVRGEWVNE